MSLAASAGRGLGALELGARSALSFARIGLDGLEERAGRALPRTPEQIADAAVITRLLAEHPPWPSPDGAAPPALPEIANVRLPGVDFESSNCRNFLLELEYADAAAAEREGAPRTLYAKLPCAELATRSFGNTLGFWPLEVTFCQRVAAAIPIRVPRVHVAAVRGARFVLLLENLHETPGTQLFINRDMAAGTTAERAERVLRAFARMHAHFHGADEAERERLLPARLATTTAGQWPRMPRALNALSLAPARRTAPELVSERLVETCRLTLDRWEAVVEAWYGGPLTIVHGDSHLGNCFEYPGEKGVEVGMIDFQAVHWSKGMRDVQYFLINSLDPEVLEENEQALIRGYCAALAEHGVTLTFEDAFEQYRMFTYQTLMVGIVPLGFGGLTERDETVLAITRRSTQAFERLGFRDWLDGL